MCRREEPEGEIRGAEWGFGHVGEGFAEDGSGEDDTDECATGGHDACLK